MAFPLSLPRIELLLVFCCLVAIVNGAWESCSLNDGGGVCPAKNTCCRTNYSSSIGSSCITQPAHVNGTGSCCTDDGVGLSGCSPGYQCASKLQHGQTNYFCRRFDPTNEGPQELPRYKLCTLAKQDLMIHTLPIGCPHGSKLAYFSSMGSLDDDAMLDQHRLTTQILIIVHGSDRNADDYLCCGLSSVPKEMKERTLVISPWFLAPADNVPSTLLDGHLLLRWNETGPIPHTWRYGAESATDGRTSSFEAMDVLIKTVMFDIYRFTRLERIIVAGHSAGGQFTHRWALTSASSIWGDYTDIYPDGRVLPLRVVAANPRSFCYLDNRRYQNGSFVVPNEQRIKRCPGYNAWEWGLEMDGRVPGPAYVKTTIQKHGGAQKLIDRHAQRDVVYLAGAEDILPVHSECEDDDFQGSTRFQRSQRYHEYLEHYYGFSVHKRVVAMGIPHDHCLLFQSQAGYHALFDIDLKDQAGHNALFDLESIRRVGRVS